MRHQSVGVHRVDAERVRPAAGVQRVHEVVAHLAGPLVVQGHRHVGLGGLPVHGQQVDLRGGAVQRLGDDDLQHLVEELGRAGIVVVAHALQAVLLPVVQPHADHEGLQDDAPGLQGPAHRAGVLVAGLDAVGDQDDDVAGLGVVGKITGGLLQRPGDGGGAHAAHGLQHPAHLRHAALAERHFQPGVVAVLFAGFDRGLVPVQTKRQLQVRRAFQLLQAFQQELPGGVDLRLVAPEGVHAVAGVHHEQHAGDGPVLCGQPAAEQQGEERDERAEGTREHDGGLKSRPTSPRAVPVRVRPVHRSVRRHATCGCPS